MYLAGTVMLIFGMGLYGLFISNVPPGVPPVLDRALKGSSLFGMFSLKVSIYYLFMSYDIKKMALERLFKLTFLSWISFFSQGKQTFCK